jgi:hypothetical protein
MGAISTAGIPVIDFRRQSMVLQWNSVNGTWAAFDDPPALVHGVALIRAAKPNICLFGRDGGLQLQVGSEQYSLAEDAPRLTWSRGSATFGLRRRFTVESSGGAILLSHAYWNGQGDEFFSWLVSRAGDLEWRTANARQWSEGVQPIVVRSS